MIGRVNTVYDIMFSSTFVRLITVIRSTLCAPQRSYWCCGHNVKTPCCKALVPSLQVVWVSPFLMFPGSTVFSYIVYTFQYLLLFYHKNLCVYHIHKLWNHSKLWLQFLGLYCWKENRDISLQPEFFKETSC